MGVGSGLGSGSYDELGAGDELATGGKLETGDGFATGGELETGDEFVTGGELETGDSSYVESKGDLTVLDGQSIWGSMRSSQGIPRMME